MEPKRLFARVAPYLDSIAQARGAGVSLVEIGAWFGAGGKEMYKAIWRAKRGLETGRLSVEQKPLPTAVPSTRQDPIKPLAQTLAPGERVPLPGEKGLNPMQETLAKRGIVFK